MTKPRHRSAYESRCARKREETRKLLQQYVASTSPLLIRRRAPLKPARSRVTALFGARAGA